MRRLFRIPLQVANAASLVSLALSLSLWARSYWRSDSLTLTRTEISDHSPDEFPTCARTIETLRGGLWILHARQPCTIYLDNRPGPTRLRFESVEAPNREIYLPGSARDTTRWIAGFAYGPTSSMSDIPGLRVPLWSIAVPSALLPLMTLWQSLRRRQRSNQGFCRTCGYDLRATPARCPECGTRATII